MHIRPFSAVVEPDMTKPLVVSAILMVVLIVLFWLVKRYRKWVSSDEAGTGTGFTLSDLRKFHKEGKMTTEEYEKAKAILLGPLKAAADKPVLGPRTPRPPADAEPGQN